MKTKLKRIAEIARKKLKEKFTSLYHLLNIEMLKRSHYNLPANRAVGVDGVSKEDYEAGLDENLAELVKRLKSMSYRPQPVRRVYIPKENNRLRPLGIPAYEDKIVQQALKEVLESIYEQDFLDCSYGFRPNRSCHDALKQLNRTIEKERINYVVDADIRGFFDNVDHKWMVRCLEQRIADPNIIRLVVRFLKAGVMEQGVWEPSTSGTAQGGNISPLLANIYLHYVLDLWFEKVVKKNLRGMAFIYRYADDFVCCFEHKEEAEAFFRALKKRLAKFGLEIAEEKSKILAFGRNAQKGARDSGRSKPETFDFLGFTHYCSQSRKGRFRVKRRTSRKKLRQKLKEFNRWIKASRNKPRELVWKRVAQKLIGHHRYYAITDNIVMVSNYQYEILRYVFKWLNRCSQRRSYTWRKFWRVCDANIPKPRIYVNIYDL